MAFILFKPFENQTKYSRGSKTERHSKTELFKMVASLDCFAYKYKLSIYKMTLANHGFK